MGTKNRTGPSTLRGSKEAKRQMVVLLETLSGLGTTTEAAERLGVSLSRYYQLETRALQGMLGALEKRPRGPRKTQEGEIKELLADKRALERELRQARSLLRAASRSVGVKPAANPTASKKRKGTRRRRGTRGKAVLETLKEDTPEDTADGGKEPEDGQAQRAGAAAGPDRGE